MTPSELQRILNANPDLTLREWAATQDERIFDASLAKLGTTPCATEHDEQAAVIAWARENEHLYPELRLLYAVPNGEYRPPATAAKLKAEGVRSGIPDLCVPVARQGKHALFIEMKKQGGKASPAQVEMLELLRQYGNSAMICVGAQDAIDAIKFYLEIDE